MGLGYIIRCWQKIEVLKVPSVVDLIKNKLRKGMSVAVFINFNETKKLIYDRLFGPESVDEDLEKLALPEDSEEQDEKQKTSGRLITEDQVGFIHGGQDPEERDQVVNLFNEDKLHLVIANIKAGGVGISLHLGKRRKRGLHFPTWSAIDLKQALGRLYRANAENDVKQRIVYCSTGENKNLENPDAQEAAMASMVTNDKELNLDEVLSQIYQGKSKEEIDEEREKMVGELSQEESICHNVNRKLKNIELLNEGDLTGFQKVILVDDEK
jgi:RecG-like helicase